MMSVLGYLTFSSNSLINSTEGFEDQCCLKLLD